jgi:hypothetical protein
MARKAGQLISRGPRTWLVRVSLGRDPQSGTRKYHNKTVHGGLKEAQSYLNRKLQERDIGRLPRAAAIQLNQYLDQWLTTAAKPRLRPKSYNDYESLLRLHVRPTLGARPLGSIAQYDIQVLYAVFGQKLFHSVLVQVRAHQFTEERPASSPFEPVYAVGGTLCISRTILLTRGSDRDRFECRRWPDGR